MKYLIFLLIILTASSCATLSKDQCLNGDWKAIGLNDGLQGFRFEVISKHQEACSKYQIKIDTNEYKLGREEGLKTYCKPENALEIGMKGYSYYNVCENPNFSKNYELGKKIHNYESKIVELEAEIEQNENEMTKSSSDKYYYRSRIKNLKKEIRLTETKLLIIKSSLIKNSGDIVEILN